MKQTLHVLIVDVDSGRALAATCASKWLLPIVTCDERTRPLPMVARWLRERDIRGDVAGQWLGRVMDDSIDWLVAIAAVTGTIPASDGLEWHALDVLASSPALLEYQQWALARTLTRGRLPSVDGPFGHLCWPHDVRRWIAGAVGSPVGSLTPYRCAAHEVVVGADAGSTRVYFKGLTHDRASEVRTTRALAAIDPQSFARTLAVGRRRDESVWWLAAACAGRPGNDLHCVAQGLARLQQQVNPASFPLCHIDLDCAARWAHELLGDVVRRDVVNRACAQVRLADVAATWIPMDLDPANVLVDDADRARFIDVDDSFLGPAPLGMATLVLRCGDRALYRTYERSWLPTLTGLDWLAFETAAAVIHAWLGWTRLERNVARGAVFVDRDLGWARTRARLSKAIDALSPSRARRAGPAA
jgi:hypothetical protein